MRNSRKRWIEIQASKRCSEQYGLSKIACIYLLCLYVCLYVCTYACMWSQLHIARSLCSVQELTSFIAIPVSVYHYHTLRQTTYVFYFILICMYALCSFGTWQVLAREPLAPRIWGWAENSATVTGNLCVVVSLYVYKRVNKCHSNFTN